MCIRDRTNLIEVVGVVFIFAMVGYIEVILWGVDVRRRTRRKVLFDMYFILDYLSVWILFLTRSIPIIRPLLVVLLGKSYAARSFSPMLGWLVRIVFRNNFSLLPRSWVLIRFGRRLLRIHIGHCQRIICVYRPIIHGSLLVLDIVLNFTLFALPVIWSISPWYL